MEKETETPSMAFYNEFAEICFLRDAKKKAKANLDEAQSLYDQCKSALKAKKDQLSKLFDSEWSKSYMIIRIKWSIINHKFLRALIVPSFDVHL